jgi:peptidoglycan/LPS O-acetylase OafA/YrhL
MDFVHDQLATGNKIRVLTVVDLFSRYSRFIACSACNCATKHQSGVVMLACLLVWALVAPERSVTSRFLRSRSMVFLGTYSYGLYVYHHFISYYLLSNRTEWELARWLGSHGAAIALQATLGASVSLALASTSYELFERRFLGLKRFFETAKGPAAQRAAAGAVGRP